MTQQDPAGAQLVIRTSIRPTELAASVLRALRELDPGQPAAEFRPIRTVVDRTHSPRRFFTVLVAAFAGLGLLLASLGICGVISYSVARKVRRSESAWRLERALAAFSEMSCSTRPPGCSRYRCGNGRVLRVGPSHRITFVRYVSLGREDIWRYDPAARPGGISIGLYAGTKSFRHRAHVCAAHSVSRGLLENVNDAQQQIMCAQ